MRSQHDPDRDRDRHFLKKYGITLEQYLAMDAAQKRRCAICGRKEWTGSKRLHIDHIHKTKQVRALLCRACNTSIGHFKENPVWLRAAADYIEKYR